MDNTVRELQSQLDALNFHSDSNGPIYWNDNYFKVHFMENNKLAGRLQLSQTREYAKAFLNWYISGKGAGKLLDLWIGVVGGMLVPTSSISHEYLLIGTMFRGVIGENQAIKLDPLEPVGKLTDFIYANEGTAFSSCEAKTWYYSIYDMLDKKQTNFMNTSGVPPSVITAINYLGYLALTLLKMLVKEAAKISQHIIKNATNEYNGFWKSNYCSIKTRTPPPHKFAMQQFQHVFQKTSPSCIKVLTLVVASYVYADSFYKEDIRKVVKTSCLDYLELYGMGCLHWLIKAKESCSTSAESLMDCMATSKNRDTNLALRYVLSNYVNPACNQHTWRWARLFVDKIFTDISISKNPQYAATMAALSCGGNAESPIWKILQFRDEALKKEAINMSRTILVLLNCGSTGRRPQS